MTKVNTSKGNVTKSDIFLWDILGVGGMIEGLQILLLGILFQRLHHSNTKFWTKNQVLSFLVVSTRKS